MMNSGGPRIIQPGRRSVASVKSVISGQYSAGNLTGAVAINAVNSSVQTATVTGDITGWTITNLSGNPVLLHIDNTGEHGIVFDAANYTIGDVPTSGLFTVYLYQVGTDVYAVIADAYEAVA